jgi:hypothetical protein
MDSQENNLYRSTSSIKPLEVVPLPNKNAAIQEINDLMNELPRHAIKISSWPQYNDRPEVYFSIVHSNEDICIKYFVREQSLRAFNRHANEPVYEDSCVECFIAWDDKGYYNFEFNCLGTCLAAFGPSRENRTPLDASVIANIQRMSAINTLFKGNPDELISWYLTVKIPLGVFVEHNLQSLSGKEARANFYKCGDGLPQPHYLSWQKINTPSPDFHRPEFFGDIRFV